MNFKYMKIKQLLAKDSKFFFYKIFFLAFMNYLNLKLILIAVLIFRLDLKKIFQTDFYQLFFVFLVCLSSIFLKYFLEYINF